MAVKKTKKVVRKIKEVEPEVEMPAPEVNTKVVSHRWSLIVIGGLAVLTLFWWKTNSWPIVAIVNYWPVTRFEVNQALYKQAGAQALDSIITQKLINSEISKKKITVNDADVSKKLDEIKKSIGSEENFNQLLAMQNVSLDEVKKQIKFPMALEKLVEPSTDSAKMQENISKLLDSLRSQAKIWMIK